MSCWIAYSWWNQQGSVHSHQVGHEVDEDGGCSNKGSLQAVSGDQLLLQGNHGHCYLEVGAKTHTRCHSEFIYSVQVHTYSHVILCCCVIIWNNLPYQCLYKNKLLKT